jgi:hypothetical protein
LKSPKVVPTKCLVESTLTTNGVTRETRKGWIIDFIDTSRPALLRMWSKP